MKRISLSGTDQYAIVDDEDYQRKRRKNGKA